MSLIGKQTKKLLKKVFLFTGIGVLFLARMSSGQSGGHLSNFSDKAKAILAPKASADVPIPPYSQSSYYSQGGYDDDGGTDSAGGSSDAGGGSSDGSSSCDGGGGSDAGGGGSAGGGSSDGSGGGDGDGDGDGGDGSC